MGHNVIIIGGGQAGAMSAIGLRQHKYQGSILLIAEEKYLPYQRPPLSKGYLVDQIKEKSLYLKSASYYEKNDIQIIKNKTVSQINKGRKSVVLNNDKEYYYEKLVITSGSILNTINPSCNQTNLHYLRTLDDSNKIKLILNKKEDLVIIGAGYIGLEIAAAAIKRNLKVSVIEMENRVMSRSVCSETSDFFQKKHEEKGIRFYFNVSVTDIEDNNNQKRIICSDGTTINADAVIIGIGIKPNVELALQSGLTCNDGIVVDENGQTSDENIFAAGDCTNHPNNILKRNIRLESVHNAVEQAKTVAAYISGNKKPYNQVPWFWSEQYNLKLQIGGISQDHDFYVVDGNIKEEKFSVYYIKNKKLIAIDAINNQKEFMKGKKLIALDTEIPQEILQNIEGSLKNWIINQ